MSNHIYRLEELQKLMASGHCVESKSAVQNSQGYVRTLVPLYFYYIKECVRKDFPPLPWLRSELGAEAAPYGGYIDTTGEVEAKKYMAFLGNCNAAFTTSQYNVYLCWVRHTSHVKAIVTDCSQLHLDCFEGSSAEVEVASPKAKVIIRQYGKASVLVSGHTEGVTIKKYDCNTYK